MTDRFNGLVVVLDKDIREDDAEALINAIKMIKGVASVKGNVSSVDSAIAETRVRVKMQKMLHEFSNELMGWGENV